jgi:hypothetical protein
MRGSSQLVPAFHQFTMKAARYYGPGDVRVENIPEPELKPGQVKLKVRARLIYHLRGTHSRFISLHGMSNPVLDWNKPSLRHTYSRSGAEVSTCRCVTLDNAYVPLPSLWIRSSCVSCASSQEYLPHAGRTSLCYGRDFTDYLGP